MQVVLKIYVYYNDKLFGIFQWFHKNQISCLDGLIKHGTLYTAHSTTCIMFWHLHNSLLLLLWKSWVCLYLISENVNNWKSLSIAFLAISDQYATFILFTKWLLTHSGGFFLNCGSPISAKNNRVLPLCVIKGYAKYEVDLWIYNPVRDATSFLSIFIQNGHERPFCFSDWCYGEYEFDWCICDKVMACASKHWHAAAAAETAETAEMAAAEPKTEYPRNFQILGI